MKRGWLALPAVMVGLVGAASDSNQPLSMGVEGLRSTRGNILICVTRQPRYFPDCTSDPDRRHFAVPAGSGAIALGAMAPGEYAIAIIHDENGNGKLDTFAGIPREGVGFSRNPTIRFGAPSFRSAQFAIGAAPVRQDVKVRYFL
ncbi:DUF2141 domain-containing protein [Sphingobium mellinum]|uniref:DUF2141 domain-containing protein n=1 Tax=Sphingobium mellinum TaxID=1387166 RepID=UPI003BF561CF